jgi:hypothetical protein
VTAKSTAISVTEMYVAIGTARFGSRVSSP